MLLVVYSWFASSSLNLLNPHFSRVTSPFKPFLIGVSVRFISGYDLTLCQILESLTMNESVNYSPKDLRAGVKLVRVWFGYPCWGHY